MAGLLDPFLRGLGGESEQPSSGPASSADYKPRLEHRQTPPFSVVRAEIDGPEDTLYCGQLWDVSRSGACVSLGWNIFKELKNAKVLLRIRSSLGAKVVERESTVCWVDISYGATFVGLHFLSQLAKGTFLDQYLDVEDECCLSVAELNLILVGSRQSSFNSIKKRP